MDNIYKENYEEFKNINNNQDIQEEKEENSSEEL